MSATDPGTPTLWRAVRRIFALGRPYRLQLWGAISLWMVASATFLLVPLGLRGLVDVAFVQENRTVLNQLALGLLVLFVVQAVVSFFASYLLSWTGERIVADFRKRIYAHLQSLSLRFFNDARTGNLTSRLTSDVETVRTAVTGTLSDLLTVGLRVAGSAALLVLISWRLAALVLVVVPAAALLTRHLGERLRVLSRDVQDRLAHTASVAEETLSCIRVVMAFGRNAYETARYGAAVEQHFDAALRRTWLQAIFSAVVVFLFFAPTAAIFWFGGSGGNRGTTHPRRPGRLLLLRHQPFTGNWLPRHRLRDVQHGGGGFGTSLRAPRGASRHGGRSGCRAAPPVAGRVRFERVTFGYDPAAPVLRGVTFEVASGEIVAVVGPSGAGKTTLLSLISRFYDPDAGRILLDGRDVRTVQLRSLREQIAVVSQDVQLFNDTARENIRYGRLEATDAEVEEAARAANAHAFILALSDGYGTVVGERGVKLSGGQRQRIAIARALLKQAPILLLDEATSALDSESETLVKQALERLLRGRTALVVAHRLATVRDADRILVVEDGRVVEEGTHAHLAGQCGLYSRLAARQFVAAE